MGDAYRSYPLVGWVGLKYHAAEKRWKWADGSIYNPDAQPNLWPEQKLPEAGSDDICVKLIPLTINGVEKLSWAPEDCDAPIGLAVCTKNATTSKHDVIDVS